ncbi:MAG: class II glutamine amidotransferase [Polyangiales bacterium]
MARLMGIMANRRDRIAAVAHQERDALASELQDSSTTVSGIGIGFYQGDEVLHKKQPRRDSEPIAWRTFLEGVKTDCAVMHARRPTVGDFRSENTHPFRYRRWLFAHTGTLERFDAIRDGLRNAVHDFLLRNVRGQTDSELLFHVILSFLHDAGRLDDRGVTGDDVVLAMRAAVSLVDRLSAEIGAPTPDYNILLTNGRLLGAMSRGARLHYVERVGLHDPPTGLDPVPVGDPRVLRYVFFASGDEAPAGFATVKDGSTLVVDRDIVLHVHE